MFRILDRKNRDDKIFQSYIGQKLIFIVFKEFNLFF